MRCTRNKGGGEAVVSLVHNASHQTPAGVLPGKRTKDMMLLLGIFTAFSQHAGRRADTAARACWAVVAGAPLRLRLALARRRQGQAVV